MKRADPLLDVPGQRIEELQRLDLVVEQRDAQRVLGVLRREDVEHVAAHAKRAALEVGLVARVLHLRQPLDRVALGQLVALASRAGSCCGTRTGSPMP